MLKEWGPAVALRAASQILAPDVKWAGKGILRWETRIPGGQGSIMGPQRGVHADLPQSSPLADNRLPGLLPLTFWSVYNFSPLTVDWIPDSDLEIYKWFQLWFSDQVLSDSLQPHGLQHARLPCPSPSPGACPNSCPSSRWCHPPSTSGRLVVKRNSNEISRKCSVFRESCRKAAFEEVF